MSRLFLAIFILLTCHNIKAQTFNGTGGAIPDGGPQTCFPITVTGVGPISASYGLASVCLHITHSWDPDLEIYLTAPDGTMIPLSIQNGIGGAGYTNTCFTATASTPISLGTPPFTGSYLPQGDLGTVNNGQNADAIWKLCIQDLSAPDAGNLISWSLLFNNTPAIPPVIPQNDEPCNAIPLTVGSGCNYTNYTNEHATSTTGVPDPGCGYSGGDVWFSVTVPAGGALIFNTQEGGITDGGMAIYSGSCNALTLITCNDDGNNNGSMPTIAQNGLAPGSTVWIRMWEYGNNNNGSFGICVSTPPPSPTNDEPCNAINLPVEATCSYSIYTNAGSTATPGVPAPGCGNYAGKDVWFKVTVPASGSVFVNSSPGTMFNGDMAVYKGTCNALTLVSCDGASSPNNSPMASITLTGQTPGTVLWVRFWNNSDDDPGSFQICASEPPPPTVQDCPAAIPICQNVYHEAVSYSGTGNIPHEINAANSCLNEGERADVWYTFTVQNAGFLNFTISPNVASEDYDWEVYNLTGHTCHDIYSDPSVSVSCNFSGTDGDTGPTKVNGQTSQGAAGSPFNQQIPVLAGQTYVINVSNYSTSTHGYSIDFGASTAHIFDNVAPYLQSVNPASSCGGNLLSLNFSENVLCSSIQNADFSVTGPGGTYNITGWTSASCSAGADYGNNITLTLSPAITINGSYQVCLTSASGSVTDLCGNVAPPACLNFNITATTPAFNNITGQVCQGGPVPVLPAISANGINGTWDPAIVSNAASATYTFTPATGQCAVPLSVPVTVTTGILPTFDPVLPICTGSAAPVLPAVSTNGIAGTWNPAVVNNTASASYTFTPNNGQCGLQASLAVTVTSSIIPAFNPVTPICRNSAAPVLPTTSINGITGTWLPATVSNIASGNYTFTPGPGQCATSKSLFVTVHNITTSTTNKTICNNQLPYSWNGNSYPIAGNYSVTLTGTSGCDSIATLNLTVKPIATSTTNKTICNNQLPYSWNGNSYPIAGIYSVTLTSTSGCDSIATLNLTVKPIATSTTNKTICNNQLPYSWNGNSYPTAGIYSVTLTSISGCDSIATLNLTVKPIATSTTNKTICNNQLPYSWNGNSYPTAGIYSVTLTSTSGCDSIATLNLTVKPIATSTTNKTICNNQLPYSWNGNSYPTAGIYSVTLTSTSGCDSIVTLNLVANAVVTSTTDISICNNQLPYNWNGNSYPIAGNYSVTLISSAGCDSIATLNLVANAVVTSTTDITICNNQLPYSWNGNSYPIAGIYSVTLISSAGCDSIATLNLVANAVVTSTTDISICNNQLPYSWNENSYPIAGNYSVTLISSTGCDSIATLNLVANAVVTSSTDITICNNQLPYSWNGNSYPIAGIYSVTLTSTSECDSIATLNLVTNAVVTSTTDITICNNQLPYSWNGNSYSTAGIYSVTLTSISGCDSIATLNLVANAVLTSTTDINICNNQLPYSWNGNSYPTAGIYSIALTGTSGCDSIATLNLVTNAVVTSTADISICNNQLPYSWNGNSYSTAGIYSVTLTSISGCDSIATLNLVANAVVTSTTDINICNNQLPYSWNGNSYPIAGIYSVTLISSAGCDSIATLNLIVNAVVTSTTDIMICNNQLPYSWNGNSYSIAGNYSVTLTSTSGCDSIATLNLVTNAVVTSTTDIMICNNQLPYSWNGNSYSTAGIYSVTLTSISGCDSIATLNLVTNAVVTSTTDISICNNQLPYSWNGNSYSIAGNYSVTLTSTSGCDSIVTLNLVTNAVVTSTTDITICNNQLPYSWNGNSYSIAGIYSVTLTSTSGCDSIATLNLVANAVVTSTTDITICNNQLPYSWNGNSYPIAGIYSVTLTGTSGCDSIATLNLVANNVVTSTTDISICNNQLPYNWNGNSYPIAGNYSVTLISSAGCDSIATLNLVANAVVTSTTDINICNNQLPYSWNGNSYPIAGIYSVTLISSAGCDSIATLNLIVNAVVTSTTDIMICNNQLPYSWNGNSYSIAGNYSVTLTSTSGCDSIATLNLVTNAVVTSTTDISICNNQLPYSWNGNSYSIAGNYSVTLTSTSGCDSIATLNLVANNVVTSTTDISICNNQLPYNWNGNSYPIAGNYSVTLISSAGCDSIAILNLVANAVVTSTTDITICNNQLPYSWNGNSYPIAGIYSVTLISSAGCDSIATLNLVTNATVTSTTDISICNNQLPYTWNGNSYPIAGSYSVTLTSISGCDSIATLNLTVKPIATSTTNKTICNNQLPYSWNGNSYPTAGIYSVTLTSTSGCDSIVTLNLVANAVVTSTTDITICNNQLPYGWNGNSYSTAGIYSVTLISSAGCDSIATLNLVTNAVVTSSTNVTICNNQLPYSWNGNNYSTAGIYSITLTSTSGCDSIVTLNLVTNAVVTSTTDITICNNQLPYSWNGNSYPIAGIYSVTLTSTSGCDSIVTLNLVTNAVSSSITNKIICSNQLPYNWNGQNYTTGGVYGVTLTNSAGCDSVATLNLTIISVASSLTTASTCDNQLPYAWNGQDYMSGGVHIVTLTNSAGCDSVATLNLTITPVAPSLTTVSACNNQLPYRWNGNSYSTAGIHSVTLTGTSGCDSIATLALTINPVVTSITDTSICSASLPYNWNGRHYNSTGTYVVILTSAAGCDSVATLNLTVNQTPAAPATIPSLNYCQYEPTTAITATITTAGSQLVWYTSLTGGTGSAIAPVPSSSLAGITNYYVSQVNGSCESPRVLITVTVNSKPALGVDKSLKICFGQTADLAGLYTTSGYGTNWTLDNQVIENDSAVDAAGLYQLVAQNPSGCADTALVNLDINPPVVANAGNDDNVETNAPYQLSGSGGLQYQWSPADLLNNPFIANPVALLHHDETFILMAMDDIGCFGLDTVKLKVINGPTFYVPSAFSPNGDGLNDSFGPTAIGIRNLEFFRIFNRYGELVFETHDLSKAWDGTYKGKKQNIDTYIWSLKGTDRFGHVRTLKGSVVLVR